MSSPEVPPEVELASIPSVNVKESSDLDSIEPGT